MHERYAKANSDHTMTFHDTFADAISHNKDIKQVLQLRRMGTGYGYGYGCGSGYHRCSLGMAVNDISSLGMCFSWVDVVVSL